MKGPFQRLRFDLRRLWECPVCGRHTRAPGDATFCICSCQEEVPRREQQCMRLVEEFTRRELTMPPRPLYVSSPETRGGTPARPAKQPPKKKGGEGPKERRDHGRDPDIGRAEVTPQHDATELAAATPDAELAAVVDTPAVTEVAAHGLAESSSVRESEVPTQLPREAAAVAKVTSGETTSELSIGDPKSGEPGADVANEEIAAPPSSPTADPESPGAEPLLDGDNPDNPANPDDSLHDSGGESPADQGEGGEPQRAKRRRRRRGKRGKSS